MVKHCSQCKATKPVTEFVRSRSSFDGLFSYCKNCKKIYSKVWWKQNKQHSMKLHSEWVSKNRKIENAHQMKSYRKDPKRKMLSNKRWQKAHHQQYRSIANAADQRRRAREHNVLNTLTTQQWIEQLQTFNYHCAYCLKPFDDLEQEHMQPISKGGEHTIENIIPACRGCNASKGSQSLLEFASNILGKPISAMKETSPSL